MQYPSDKLFKAAKRVLRYLIGTFDLRLCYHRGESNLDLHVFSDASYTAKLESYPTTGVAIYLGDSIIEWVAKRQRILATSTTEAELNGVVEGFQLVEPIRQILQEELLFEPLPVTFHCDNSSTVSAIQNGSFVKTAHVSHRSKAVAQRIPELGFKVKFVPTEMQRADLLTKPQPSGAFMEHRRLLYSQRI